MNNAALKNAYRKSPAYERMKRFLSSYGGCKRICDEYEKETSEKLVGEEEKEIRDAFYNECKKRCESVESFISGIGLTPDERHLLTLHYISGISIENASEKMYVSRSTAFRINMRAEYKALLFFVALEGERDIIS